MAKGNDETLTAKQETQLRQSTEDHAGEIQKKIDSLRGDGTNRIATLQNSIDTAKRDRSLAKEERENRIATNSAEMEKAKAIEAKNKGEIVKLISNAESYLKAYFDEDYYLPLEENCEQEKAFTRERYDIKVAELNKEHENTPSKLTDRQEIKDKKYVHKNRLFDVKMNLDKELQRIKDGRHMAFVRRHRLIDMLHLSKLTFVGTRAQKRENYKHALNRKAFLLQNGLYITIILIFAGLCIVALVIKDVQLPIYNNILNILQQVFPRMFLALGATGLILLIDMNLSIGCMVGMGMTTVTIIMHQGINTGVVLGHVFDFTGVLVGLKVVFTLAVCIILCTCFTAIGGFFTAKFKMHPSISTAVNMLVIFEFIVYTTESVSFGIIESAIPKMIAPKIDGFPTIILRAVAAIVIAWFIWNKTIFSKNLYAVNGNPRAAAVSGIPIFGVTMETFILAGILYGSGSWLECVRMVNSGFAAYDQGWEMDAIVAYVVGGVSPTGDIGKVSGVIVGMLIFIVLIYSLVILGVDTDPQFIFEGIVIITAVVLDRLKCVQRR